MYHKFTPTRSKLQRWGALGVSADDLRPDFESAEIAGYVHQPSSMPYENFPIYLCRGLKVPLIELWPLFKNWN